MAITTALKIIKIGDSAGVVLPAKDLKRLNLKPGDIVEITVRTESEAASDADVMAAARFIMRRYNKALKNLADR